MVKHLDTNPALSDAVRELIVEDDVQMFVTLRGFAVGIRRAYIQLYDYFIKNWDHLHRAVRTVQSTAMHG